MDYVAGFLFSPDKQRVVLINKLRPDWQKGRINAPGGKIEPGETPLDAIKREFKEEAGVEINDWKAVATLKGFDWSVNFFRAYGDVDSIKSMTDEQVKVYPLSQIPSQVLTNLKWLIPLSLDEKGGVKFPIEISYDK